MKNRTEFHGAKVALFVGDDLVVYLRDDKPGIPWPGWWDFPGGGREGEETPQETVIRETWEEFALTLQPSDLVYAKPYDPAPDKRVWFFAARLPRDRAREIRFGDEGQQWALWSQQRFLGDPRAVPVLKDRLIHYLFEK
ncbi:NUDIX hydrolase [Shimia ponticola]|uniref:NUDIX hydrolase n=1 Tax=Shimia ponticola TaxID=2582893 RepID=UPI0011BF6F00|nr:NUDIX hydrolase [Shimia ponticola]